MDILKLKDLPLNIGQAYLRMEGHGYWENGDGGTDGFHLIWNLKYSGVKNIKKDFAKKKFLKRES